MYEYEGWGGANSRPCRRQNTAAEMTETAKICFGISLSMAAMLPL